MGNHNYIRIRLNPDSDGSAELRVEYSINGFSGRGSAWFDLIDLEKKVDRFLDYPLSNDDLPCIRGGYWTNDGAILESEHVFLSASPIGQLGSIVILIRCATEVDVEHREPRCSGSAEIITTYQQLAQFAAELKDLVNLKLDEVMLVQEGGLAAEIPRR